MLLSKISIASFDRNLLRTLMLNLARFESAIVSSFVEKQGKEVEERERGSGVGSSAEEFTVERKRTKQQQTCGSRRVDGEADVVESLLLLFLVLSFVRTDAGAEPEAARRKFCQRPIDRIFSCSDAVPVCVLLLVCVCQCKRGRKTPGKIDGTARLISSGHSGCLWELDGISCTTRLNRMGQLSQSFSKHKSYGLTAAAKVGRQVNQEGGF